MPSALVLPENILRELVTYYAIGESDFGLRSIQGPMQDMADRGGPGGSPTQEGGVTDRKFALRTRPGDMREGSVTRARRVYQALAQLERGTGLHSHGDVLFAAHGQEWSLLLDSAFGKGTATKARKAVGEHVGVALLTATVARGWAAERATKAGAVRPAATSQQAAANEETDAPLRARVLAVIGPVVDADTIERSEAAQEAHGRALDALAATYGVERRGAVPGLVLRGHGSPAHLSASHAYKPLPQRWKDHPDAWSNEGGWLVRRVLEKDTAILSEIRKESTALLSAAWEAYAIARGCRLAPPQRKAPEKTPPPALTRVLGGAR